MAHILVAESNKTVADYIKTALKKGFHSFDYADNALDAWRASGTTTYDVMIIDASMPGIDGFVLAQRALQESPGMQVVFVNGFSAVALDAQAGGIQSFSPLASHPFHLRELNAKIRQLLTGTLTTEIKIPPGSAVLYPDFTRKSAAVETQDAAHTAG